MNLQEFNQRLQQIINSLNLQINFDSELNRKIQHLQNELQSASTDEQVAIYQGKVMLALSNWYLNASRSNSSHTGFSLVLALLNEITQSCNADVAKQDLTIPQHQRAQARVGWRGTAIISASQTAWEAMLGEIEQPLNKLTSFRDSAVSLLRFAIAPAAAGVFGEEVTPGVSRPGVIDCLSFWRGQEPGQLDFKNCNHILFFPDQHQPYYKYVQDLLTLQEKVCQADPMLANFPLMITTMNYAGVGRSTAELSCYDEIVKDGSQVLAHHLLSRGVDINRVFLLGEGFGANVALTISKRISEANNGKTVSTIALGPYSELHRLLKGGKLSAPLLQHKWKTDGRKTFEAIAANKKLAFCYGDHMYDQGNKGSAARKKSILATSCEKRAEQRQARQAQPYVEDIGIQRIVTENFRFGTSMLGDLLQASTYQIEETAMAQSTFFSATSSSEEKPAAFSLIVNFIAQQVVPLDQASGRLTNAQQRAEVVRERAKAEELHLQEQQRAKEEKIKLRMDVKNISQEEAEQQCVVEEDKERAEQADLDALFNSSWLTYTG